MKNKIINLSIYTPGIYPPGKDDVVSDMLAPAYLKTVIDLDNELSRKYDVKIMYFSTKDSSNNISNKILKENPNIVGFSTYLWNYYNNIDIASLLKSQRKDIKTIFGGPSVTYNSREVMEKFNCVDLIVSGAGESRFKEILRNNFKDLKKIIGIHYRKGKEIISNEGHFIEDLSKIPSAFKSINLDNGKEHFVCLETMRGCPFDCAYCQWGEEKQFQKFPLEQILEDIDIIYNNPNVKACYITDSCTFYSPKRGNIIMEKIGSCKYKIPTIMNFDINLIDLKLIKSLDNVNLFRNQFNFGLQTSNTKALENIGKKQKISKFKEKISLLKKNKPNADVVLDLIYGLPGDDFNTFKDTINFSLDLNSSVYFSPLFVMPGTRFYNMKDKFSLKFDNAPLYMLKSSNTFSKEDMNKAFKLSNWFFSIQFFPELFNIIQEIPKYNNKFKRINLFQDFFNRINNEFNSIKESDYKPNIEYINQTRKTIMNNLSEQSSKLYYLMIEFLDYYKTFKLSINLNKNFKCNWVKS